MGPMSSEPAVLATTADGVCTLTLNRPEAKNSLSVELVGALYDALAAAIAEESTRVVVLTNAGNTFCAGADLKASRPGVGAGSGPTFVDVFKLIQASPTPIVGRIDGHATGGGVGLVAACDLSVMRDDAKIGFTEVRLGVAPAVISVVCLPKMRRSDASELFLTGRRFTPSHAAEVGLINRAAPADEIDEVVDGWVGELVRGGPVALGAAKDLLTRIPDMDDDKAFDWTSVRSQELFDGPEAQAGIAAFRDRTDAPWVPEKYRA